VTDGALYLVRHAKAGDRSTWDGDDRSRPLSKKGRAQAGRLATRLGPLVSTHSAALLVSSPYLRCVQTLEPLAALLDRNVAHESSLAEGYDRDGALTLLAALPVGSVLCSHGDVIPDVMAALERRGAVLTNEPDWRKATCWVLERRDGDVVQATCWPPPADD